MGLYDVTNPPKRRIYANGYYSDWFDIKSGVAQGCPVSPLLFLIIAQALRVAMDEEGVEGISIGDIIAKISQFADDTTLILRDTDQLKPAFSAIHKWCMATGMRENLKKREGLALGSYRTQRRFTPGSRTQHEYIKSIKWAQEGQWVISLGVPIGNDLDHTAWWRKKIEAVRIIANKWKNIARRGYFGRSLVTQAMYYGRYRFWLWSLAVPQSAVNAMQVDADRLQWAKDPVLNDLPKRIRRCVAHRTAIGPRTKGGLNEMLWSDHVKAIQAQVVMRYLHPAKALWKEVLDVMLLRNKKGEELFGAGRGILMCPLSVGEKTKLLSNLPKRSAFFKSCIRAHWQRGYQQDLDLTTGLSAETLWHNPRFRVECDWRVRHYFVNTLSVTQISDIIDYETDQPFDDARWAEWIRTYHRDSARANLDQGEVDLRVRQIRAVVDQVPGWIVRRMSEGDEDEPPQEGELVALMTPDAQDEGDDHVEYATIEEDEAVGTRFHMHVIDAVGKEHRTGERACILDMDVHKVAWWGDRVQGPVSSTFPMTEGWKVGEEEVKLHEVTVKNTYREFVRRKFKPATAQEGWSSRLGMKIPWGKAWRCSGCYSSPRDRLTMMKLMRRNLFTAQRNPDTDGVCLLCSQQESQLHLVECDRMYGQYWEPLVRLMRQLGFTVPLYRAEINAMLITFRVTDTTVVGREQASIIEMGWRCLYAALVRTRVDGTPLTLKHAVLRCMRMVHSRVTGYGRKWELWMIKQLGRKEYDQKRIPEKYQKRALIKQSPLGDYEVEPILSAGIAAHKESDPVTIPGTRQRRRVARQRPPSPPGRPPGSNGSFTPPPTEAEEDPWRDMAGDALTSAQARGGHAECNLATARNLRREEGLTREYMRARQLGGADGLDTRFPDWIRILQELQSGGECTVQLRLRNLTDPGLLDHVRIAALYTTNPPHVVALLRAAPDRMRLYDNESEARGRGTHATLTNQQLALRQGVVVAIVPSGSPMASAQRRVEPVQVGAIARARRAVRARRPQQR